MSDHTHGAEPTETPGGPFSGKSRSQLILLGCGAAVALGCFMPWAKVQFFATITASGIDAGDGWVFLGGAALFAALVWFRKVDVITLLVSLLGAVGFVYERYNIGTSDQISVSIGSGLWLIAAATVVASAVVINDLTAPPADAPPPGPGWQPMAKRYRWGLGLAAAFVVGTVAIGQEDHSGEVEGGFTSGDDSSFDFGEPDQPPIEVDVLESGFSTYPGFDDKPRATAGAVIENNGDDDVAYLEVVFTFLDADDEPVATETSYVDGIARGGTAHATLTGVELSGNAVSLRVDPIDDAGFRSSSDVTVIPLGDIEVAPDGFQGLTITGTASNPSDATVDGGSIECILRSDGEIVGGTNGYLDTMTPGAKIAWDTGFSGGEGFVADQADCSASTFD